MYSVHLHILLSFFILWILKKITTYFLINRKIYQLKITYDQNKVDR